MKGELPPEYEIQEVLGEGSNGLVYLVRDKRDDHRYAAKEFPVAGEAAQRFFRELSILFSLHHPNIIRCANLIYGGGSSNFLLLEYARGGSLRKLLATHPEGLPQETVLRVARHTAAALAAAHGNNVIHCDIKPDNILIDPGSDGQMTFKLTDLGIAFHIARDIAPKSRGTPFYMAPEQFFDNPLPASDFYALGVVLYECLTGQIPFQGCAEQLFVAHQQEDADLGPLPSESWRSLIGRMLSKSPSDRPANAEDILHSLDTIDGQPNSEVPRSPRLRPISEEPPQTVSFPSGLPFSAPGAEVLFNLGDPNQFYTADANSIDAFFPETRVVKRQVWVGKYNCSAVAKNTGDAMLVISNRLWGRRSGTGSFRMTGADLFRVDSACAHPNGQFFVLADRTHITAVTPNGVSIWSAECANYFLRPVMLCLSDGRTIVGSGPASPSVNLFSSTGEAITRFPLPGPLLALASGGGHGADATAVVQGLSATDPAKLVEISPVGVKVIASLVSGVFSASWHGSFFSLLTCRREVVTSTIDGQLSNARALPAAPVADTRSGPFYAVLEQPSGAAVIQVFRLTPARPPISPPPTSTPTTALS